MKLYLNIDTRDFYSSPIADFPLKRLSLKRRDSYSIEVVFFKNKRATSLESGFSGFLSVKKINNYSSNHLASSPNWTENAGSTTTYSFLLNLNTVEINNEFALLGASSTPLQTMLEIQWSNGVIVNSSSTLVTTINNDVIGGGEGLPVITPDTLATQAEAEAGVDNIKYMSPLRVRQFLSHVTKDDALTSELEIDAGTF
jgi:hypothetical protein